MTDVSISWSSNDPSVASVDGSGLVTAIADGAATITGTAGSASGRATVVVFEVTERAALAALYNATDGPSWVNADNWRTDMPLGDWYGVQTDDAGRVEAIDLRGQWDSEAQLPIPHGLSGSIPPELGYLPRLVSLDLGNNHLTGPIPPELGNLARLRYLGFTRNNLTGAIPPTLTSLTSLEILALGGNALTGEIPTGLGNLANMTELYLWGNDLTGPIPTGLGNLANLTVLYLSDNGLTGPIPTTLGNLTSLTVLSLRGNDLTDPIPSTLGSLASLTELYLSSNDLTGPIPAEFGNLTSLTDLSLWGNDLTGPIPPELGNLANLTDLSLWSNDLTGMIPGELGRLVGLERLRARNNKLTGPIPAELATLDSVRVLSLGENRLTGPIPPELANLPSLEELNLVSNRLSGAIPTELGNLSTVEALFLDYNDLEGALPPELGSMSSLRELGLSFNGGLSGSLPVELTELRLDALVAEGTGLCAPADPAFQNWLAGVYRRRIASCVEKAPSAAYLIQAVQSREFPVPLVAGEKALLRVFVTARQATGAGIPTVRTRFYSDGRETHVADIPGTSTPIPTEVDESSLATSANAEIPGHVVQPGLEMVIEVDLEGTLDAELGVAKRIPETGRLEVDVQEMPFFDLTLIPFVWSATYDSSMVDVTRAMAEDIESHEMFGDLHLLPIGEMRVTAHEPVLSSSNSAFVLLRQTAAIRAMEGGTGHYKGMMGRPITGAGGVAYRPGRSNFSFPRPDIIAHELGHNLGLRHAPCGGAGGPDPSFPYPDGSIGAWGYDFRDGGQLVRPSTPDLMSYCGPPDWTSDYHFTNALRFRLDDADSVGLRAPPPVAATEARSLLLWGGVDADGVPYLEPAFVVDAPPSLPGSRDDHRLIGRAASGTELFSLAFAMPEVPDGDGNSSFAFVLPVRAAWERESRDHHAHRTGRYRHPRRRYRPSRWRSCATPATDRCGVFCAIRRLRTRWPRPRRPGAPGSGLEVLFSRGMPGAEAWRR